MAFGPFHFDPASRELRKHGYKIKVASQPTQVLVALLERPGEVLTREALRNRLWPTATAGDFEHGLNAAVNRLRQALGDSANQPRYIETLPGLGYRFVAPVSSIGTAILELVPLPTGSDSEPQTPAQARWLWGAALAGLLTLASGWFMLDRWPASSMNATQFVVLPPKGYYFEGGGIRQAFALSPDGRRIAFTAKDASGAFRLFLRDFSELEPHPVTDGEGAYSVVWTPDSRYLLFSAHGKLRRAAVSGGASQILSGAIPYFSSAIPFGADRMLVSNHRNSGVMPASGGVLEPIGSTYSWAQLLPGGRDFLYTAGNPQFTSLHARISKVGGSGQGTDVVQADSRVQYIGSVHSKGGYLVYLRAGTLLAQPFDLAGHHVTAEPIAIARHVSSFGPTGAADFSVSDRGVIAYQTFTTRSQFVWVDRRGHRIAAASPAGINSGYVRLSPDGRWLAAAVFDIDRGVTDIWLYDAQSGAGRRVIFGPAISHLPVWSPDSSRLAYLSDNDWPRLALHSVDGTPDRQPLPDTGFMAPTDWSPDGRFILYNNSALPAITHDFASDVFAIDMARDRKVIPLLTTPFYENNGVFSPDGKWVAFVSDESGQAEIYIQALDRGHDSLSVRGARFLISHDGAQCLRWRRDGKELYYLGFDGRVYAVSLSFRSATVHAARPVPLFTIDAEARATIHSVVSFDVSADGNRFVIPSLTPGESSALVVLQDWESLLRK